MKNVLKSLAGVALISAVALNTACGANNSLTPTENMNPIQNRIQTSNVEVNVKENNSFNVKNIDIKAPEITHYALKVTEINGTVNTTQKVARVVGGTTTLKVSTIAGEKAIGLVSYDSEGNEVSEVGAAIELNPGNNKVNISTTSTQEYRIFKALMDLKGSLEKGDVNLIVQTFKSQTGYDEATKTYKNNPLKFSPYIVAEKIKENASIVTEQIENGFVTLKANIIDKEGKTLTNDYDVEIISDDLNSQKTTGKGGNIEITDMSPFSFDRGINIKIKVFKDGTTIAEKTIEKLFLKSGIVEKSINLDITMTSDVTVDIVDTGEGTKPEEDIDVSLTGGIIE